MRLLPLRHPGVGGGAAGAQSNAEPRRDRRRARPASLPLRHAQPRHSRGRAGRRRDQERPHDREHAAAEPDRQSAAVAMGRVRAAGPRAHRHRQGGDRPGHPDRARADRRRGARRRAGAAAHRLGRDRCQPVRGVHVGQLFDRGRRRLAAPGLRRGALAVPRSRWPIRSAARSASCRSRTEGSCARGRDTGRDYWSIAGEVDARSPGQRHGADQAAVALPDRRAQPAAPRPAGEARPARPSSTTSRRTMSCMRACCGNPGAARAWPRSTRPRCAGPPRRRSTSCARAISSRSRRRASSR